MIRIIVENSIELASVYRLTAANFRMSAEILFEKLRGQGELLPGNIRAIPFYYLMSHALELLLKCALLKRGTRVADLRKYPLAHNLDGLLQEIIDLHVPVTEQAASLIRALSKQHEKHYLRYTALLDDGEPTFTPEPGDLFQLFDEILTMGRKSAFN
jgi:hypothetical protein